MPATTWCVAFLYQLPALPLVNGALKALEDNADFYMFYGAVGTVPYTPLIGQDIVCNGDEFAANNQGAQPRIG